MNSLDLWKENLIRRSFFVSIGQELCAQGAFANSVSLIIENTWCGCRMDRNIGRAEVTQIIWTTGYCP
jgi:hypothetical protein